MVTIDCDRCEDGTAHVGMWDDDMLCGRIDAICKDCYEAGHRIRRPLEPPYNEEGELYYHKEKVDCEYCDGEHVVDVTDTFYFCPRAKYEHDTDEIDDALGNWMFYIEEPEFVEV